MNLPPASAQERPEAVRLATAVGLTPMEINCIAQQDRDCLYKYYNIKGSVHTPLMGFRYHDSISWTAMADDLNDAAGVMLESHPEDYFSFSKRAAIFYHMDGKMKQRNYALQNIGFMYQELAGKYDSSLYYINLTLDLWERAKDTLNMANLYKYRAYLASFIDIPSGHEDGHKAIRLYRSKNAEAGAMVSYRDLACLFIKEGLTDSANYYLRPAKEFWHTRNDTSRVFGINTDLIQANDTDPGIAGKLIQENELLRFGSDLPAVQLRVYYNTVLVYSRKVGDEALRSKFEQLVLTAK